MLDLSTIKIIDIAPNVSGYGLGNTVTFENVDGETYHLQRWFTDNSSGVDFYDVNYEVHTDPTDDNEDDLEVLQTFLEKVLDDYEARYEASVVPLLDEIVQATIEAARA